jgi:hypothetical protein
VPNKDKEAERAYQRAYRIANRARLDEKGREWRNRNKGSIAAKRKTYKEANRSIINAKAREYYYTTYKGTPGYVAQYTKNNRAKPAKNLARNEALLGRARPDACDACGGNDGGIVFDHCHDKGHPRGWLCDRCNCALGFVQDDIDRLRKLIVYLERNRENASPQLTLSGV